MKILIFLSFFLIFLKTNSESTTEYSTTESSSTTITTGSSSTSANESGSTSSSGSSSTASTDSSSTSTTESSSTFSSTDGSATLEKMVAYTTKQKTIFLACCGGTFILLIALAILSGLSDTIARSRQKAKRTHA